MKDEKPGAPDHAPAGGSDALRRTLGLAALALPFAAVPGLLVATSGAVAIRPQPVVLVAAVMLAGLAALGGDRRRPWDLPVAALLGLAAGHLLLMPGLPRGHDALPHLWGTWSFLKAIAAGDLFPRWLHHIGIGMPLTLFYGPVSFYLTVPFHLAGFPSAEAWKLGFVLHGTLAAASMFLVARRWTGDRRAALVAAVAYAFAPYRLLDANYRTAIAESAAFIVLPFFFAAMVAAVRHGGRRRVAAAAVATALLALTHPLTAVMAATAAGIWIAVERFPRSARGVGPWLGRSARLAGVMAVGLALAGFFVVPLLFEAPATTVDRAIGLGSSGPRVALDGLRPGQLFERRLWSDVLLSLPAGREGDGTDREMPLYVGLALLALVPLAAGAGRLPCEDADTAPPRLPVGLLWATAVALMVTLHPLNRLLALVPPLAALQFPWRFLAIATFGLAAASGFAAARLLAACRDRRRAAAMIPGLLVALLVLDAAPYTGAADWVPHPRGFVHVYRVDPECGRPWGCWETDPVPPPYPLRVVGVFVPPTDLTADVANVRAGYPEYLTPAVRAQLVDPRDQVDFARFGASLRGNPGPGFEPLDAAPYARWAPLGRGAAEPRPARRGGGRIEVELDGRPGRVVVIEQYFPGWQVETPEGWREVVPNRRGLLRADVAAGQRRLRFRFTEQRWDRLAGWALSAATAAALVVPWPRRRRAA